MPLIKSSIKDVRRIKRRRARNLEVYSSLKTALVKFNKATAKDEAQKALAQAVKKLDKAAVKGYIHPNKASRLKSRLSLRVNKMAKAA